MRAHRRSLSSQSFDDRPTSKRGDFELPKLRGGPCSAADRHTVGRHVAGLVAASEARLDGERPWCACQAHGSARVGRPGGGPKQSLSYNRGLWIPSRGVHCRTKRPRAMDPRPPRPFSILLFFSFNKSPNRTRVRVPTQAACQWGALRCCGPAHAQAARLMWHWHGSDSAGSGASGLATARCRQGLEEATPANARSRFRVSESPSKSQASCCVYQSPKARP